MKNNPVKDTVPALCWLSNNAGNITEAAIIRPNDTFAISVIPEIKASNQESPQAFPKPAKMGEKKIIPKQAHIETMQKTFAPYHVKDKQVGWKTPFTGSVDSKPAWDA